MKLNVTMMRAAVAALLLLPGVFDARAQWPPPPDPCDTGRACSSLRDGAGWAVIECRERQFVTACKCWMVRCWTEHIDFSTSPPRITVAGCETGPSQAGPFCDNSSDDDNDCTLPQNDQTVTGSGSELTTVSTECGNNSPIVIDVERNGFALTTLAGGVSFDLDSDGTAERLSWTAAGADDAFLVLDRNGNGLVDNGRELFGNFTPQLGGTDTPNGFRALAALDREASGGNGDGTITAEDAAFASLRLWRDANHDGLSEASELRALSELGIDWLDVDYKTSKRVDEHGNEFRYRARLGGKTGAGRWAWDVFLLGD